MKNKIFLSLIALSLLSVSSLNAGYNLEQSKLTNETVDDSIEENLEKNRIISESTSNKDKAELEVTAESSREVLMPVVSEDSEMIDSEEFGIKGLKKQHRHRYRFGKNSPK